MVSLSAPEADVARPIIDLFFAGRRLQHDAAFVGDVALNPKRLIKTAAKRRLHGWPALGVMLIRSQRASVTSHMKHTSGTDRWKVEDQHQRFAGSKQLLRRRDVERVPAARSGKTALPVAAWPSDTDRADQVEADLL